MYYMLDNYDSFVYNLSAYLKELGEEVLVRRADEASLSEIEGLRPAGILISPGPKTPQSACFSQEIVHHFRNRIPILGVCLGHQVIAHVFGGTVGKGKSPIHGKVSVIRHNGAGVFCRLPEEYMVTRYHSLVVEEDTLPPEIQVDARTDDGAVMAISHRDEPIYGVQFHPEAVLTQYGHEVLANFTNICKEWQANE